MTSHPTVSDEAYRLGLVLIGARACKHYKDEDCGFCQAEAMIAAGYKLIPDDPRHVIEFREDGCTIQHPLSCRPNLFDCPVNRWSECRGIAWDTPGRYECRLDGDQLVVGERIEEQP